MWKYKKISATFFVALFAIASFISGQIDLRNKFQAHLNGHKAYETGIGKVQTVQNQKIEFLLEDNVVINDNYDDVYKAINLINSRVAGILNKPKVVVVTPPLIKPPAEVKPIEPEKPAEKPLWLKIITLDLDL